MSFLKRLWKWLKKKRVWSRIKLFCIWCIYRPYWHLMKFPSYAMDYRFRKRFRRQLIWYDNFMYNFWNSILDGLTNTVIFIEELPDNIGAFAVKTYRIVKKFLMKFYYFRKFVELVKRFLKVYFFFINFRRLLIASILADFFYLRYTDEEINPDLRMWWLAWIAIFFQILWILMDGADKLLVYNAHDRFTRFYIKKYMPEESIHKRVTENQQKDTILKRYLYIRYKRNAYLALFGFYYYARPFMRSPKGRNFSIYYILVFMLCGTNKFYLFLRIRFQTIFFFVGMRMVVFVYISTRV